MRPGPRDRLIRRPGGRYRVIRPTGSMDPTAPGNAHSRYARAYGMCRSYDGGIHGGCAWAVGLSGRTTHRHISRRSCDARHPTGCRSEGARCVGSNLARRRALPSPAGGGVVGAIRAATAWNWRSYPPGPAPRHRSRRAGTRRGGRAGRINSMRHVLRARPAPVAGRSRTEAGPRNRVIPAGTAEAGGAYGQRAPSMAYSGCVPHHLFGTPVPTGKVMTSAGERGGGR
jgi:hypothetical protein